MQRKSNLINCYKFDEAYQRSMIITFLVLEIAPEILGNFFGKFLNFLKITKFKAFVVLLFFQLLVVFYYYR